MRMRGAGKCTLVHLETEETADRPYKKGLDKETAFSEIRPKTGTQFDPDTIRAFFVVVK